MKQQNYETCNHILVYSKIEYDRYEGRTYKSRGCIKCGLDNSILDTNIDFLHSKEKIKYTYLRKKYLTGIETKVTCDLDLARAIFSKIKEAHPKIDNKTAIKYFEIALDNIRNIKVNEDRKVNRAKRLSLSPDFKRWDARDVCIG